MRFLELLAHQSSCYSMTTFFYSIWGKIVTRKQKKKRGAFQQGPNSKYSTLIKHNQMTENMSNLTNPMFLRLVAKKGAAHNGFWCESKRSTPTRVCPIAET